MLVYNKRIMNQKSSVSQSDVQDFLNLYDGDAERALEAISDYSHAMRAKRAVTPTGAVLVALQDVKKTYKIGRQRVHALGGITLQIHQGEFVALTGESGSGKSTLLQLIGGLDKPTEGSVEVDGVNLQKLRDGKLSTFRNKTIGFVFQFFYLQPFLRVATNLEVPAMFARADRKTRKLTAERLAKAVGITDRMSHLPRELSGGQMQRVAIARALLNNPKILLADEPTGNLDSVNGAAIIELFELIRKKFGTTIVVVTHDNHIAARADREIRLKDGVII